MNDLMKTVLSLSLSGSVLILLLLALRPLVKDRLSKSWQYYLWLVVVARLLLPFSPAESPVGSLFLHKEPSTPGITASLPEDPYSVPSPDEPLIPAPVPAEAGSPRLRLWMVWLGGAAALFLRKVTVYQDFVRYLRAGRKEVSDTGLLDLLAREGEALGIRRPVELWTHSLISSPLLLGFFRPAIVLPAGELAGEDFRYTVRHELIHEKRKDLLYKWLVQVALCLHWFNPLVWIMARETTRACELSCDEAVLNSLAPEERWAYGNVLLRAMGTEGGYKSSLASVTLAESGERLKERLGAILTFRNATRGMTAAALFLALGLTLGAGAAGAYRPEPVPESPNMPVSLPAEPASAPSVQPPLAAENSSPQAEEASRYYEEGDLARYAAVFSLLGEGEKEIFLARSYADGKVSFFAAAINQLDRDDPLVGTFAEQAYQAGQVNFFSVLTWRMGEETLQDWLVRANRDRSTSFQMILLGILGRDQEAEILREELEQKRLEEYKSHGITKEGSLYYYKGRMVRVLMDMDHSTEKGCTLETNPLGEVDIKILRGSDGKIRSVEDLPKEETAALFGDAMTDPDKEKESLSRERLEEYRSYGITKNGKEYRYQGRLVRIFLDLEGNNSFYTLERDPHGEVDVKVTRGGDGRIVTVEEMSREEAAELLEDWSDPDDGMEEEKKEVKEDHSLEVAGANWQTRLIPVEAETLAAGGTLWLGTFAIDRGDRVAYQVTAGTGEWLTVGFARAGEEDSEVTYQTVSHPRTGGELRIETGLMTWESPLEPGEYSLFVRAESGPLGGVAGKIIVVSALGTESAGA